MTLVPRGPTVFSTAGLPLAKRVELWEDHCHHELISLACRMFEDSPLRTSMISSQGGRLRVARVRGNPHVVERTATVVRRRPADAISLYMTLAGEAFFYHGDGVHTVSPGQMIMCDSDRPFMRGFSHDLEEIDLQIPREDFLTATGVENLSSPLVVDFARRSLTARTLVRLSGRAARASDAQILDEDLVLRLVAQLVTGSSDDVQSVHLATARAFIEEHLSDPALGAGVVAAAVGLSERQLSRVFSASGTTVPKFVLSRRLESARATLMRSPELSVEAVALRSGFSSASHFSHQFRAHFGERATDCRQRARRSGL